MIKKVPSWFSWVKKQSDKALPAPELKKGGLSSTVGPPGEYPPPAWPEWSPQAWEGSGASQPLSSPQIPDNPWLQTCQNLPAGSLRGSLVQIAPNPVAVAWDGSEILRLSGNASGTLLTEDPV